MTYFRISWYQLGPMPTDCQRTVHRALGRVRTHSPKRSPKGGLVSKVTQPQALSRLRRCRLGNCTLVTFGQPSNRQMWPGARPAADMPVPELHYALRFAVTRSLNLPAHLPSPGAVWPSPE